jgi:hypothetical protein
MYIHTYVHGTYMMGWNFLNATHQSHHSLLGALEVIVVLFELGTEVEDLLVCGALQVGVAEQVGVVVLMAQLPVLVFGPFDVLSKLGSFAPVD